MTNNRIYGQFGRSELENGYDNTLSVISLASFTEEQKIAVGTNPDVAADSQDIYLTVTATM